MFFQVEKVVESITPDVKLAVLSHISSIPALVLPVEELARVLSKRGVTVVTDGLFSSSAPPSSGQRLGRILLQ